MPCASYSAGVSSTSDPLWQTAFEKVYTEPALQNDWWITVGNHDYGHGFPGIQAQIDYTGLSKRWQFPSNFYAQTFAVDTGVTAQFVFLDTVNLTSAQQTWAQAQLKASTADYLWVVGHYPIYSGGSHGNVMESSPLHSWLQAANVTAYLCGHDHDLQHLQSNGIDFFVNGGGSTERDDGGDIPQTVFHSGASGTGMAEMTKESVTWTYNDESGSVLYTTTIAPRPMSEGAVRAREAAFASSPPPSARDQIIISDEDIPALRDAVMAHVNPAGPQPIVIEVPAERPHHL